MKSYRYGFTLTCLLSLLLADGMARAQTDYPSKPVRIISDSAPGSAIDVGLRIIADGLTQHWNQQVVVVNQPGAKGTPEAVINRASADLRAVLVKPEIRDKLAARGSFVRPMTPQEVLNYINDQQTLWKPALERVAVQTQK
jgi:tripartite-type tricarboxylate transporter receptor subunit TctC